MKDYTCIKSVIEDIKSHLQLILLIPTVLGGLWQVVELTNISIPFIRYFSLTQVIPDGLLILTVFGFIWLAILVANLLLRKNEQKTSEKTPLFITGVLLVMCSILVIYFIYLPLLDDFRNPQLSILLLIIILTIMLFKFFIEGIVRILASLKKSLKRFGGININMDKNKNVLNSLFYIFIFVGVIGLIRTSPILLSTLYSLKNTYVYSCNSNNMENVICKMVELYGENIEYQILYFNDKYYFIKFKDSSNLEKIEILKFDEQFNYDCKK